jgi:hypothetical protein
MQLQRSPTPSSAALSHDMVSMLPCAHGSCAFTLCILGAHLRSSALLNVESTERQQQRMWTDAASLCLRCCRCSRQALPVLFYSAGVDGVLCLMPAGDWPCVWADAAEWC